MSVIQKKISIITPSLNQGRFIEDNIISVLNQNYQNYEHIVVDGGSEDDTLEILKKYKHLKWISEKDKGAANAINNGFRLAEGEIFGWLNADDFYDNNVLETINNEFNNGFDMVYGNLTFLDEFKNLRYADKTVEYNKEYLLNFAPDVRQPSTFFSRRLFERTGGLNESLKLVFDFELIIRMLENSKIKLVDKNFAFYRDYDQTLTRKFVRRQAIELFFTGRKYGSKLLSVYNRKILKKLLFGKL